MRKYSLCDRVILKYSINAILRTDSLENNGEMTKNEFFWRLFISILLLGATFFVCSKLVNFPELIRDFSKIPLSIALSALFFGSVSWILRGIRTRLVFQKTLEARVMTYLAISFVHNSANNLLPMRLGELVLPILLRKLVNMPFNDGVKGLIGIRLLDVLALFGTFLFFFFGIFYPLVSCFLFFVFILFMPLFLNSVFRFFRFALVFLFSKKENFDQNFLKGKNELISKLWWLTSLSWLCKISGMTLILISLSQQTIESQIAIILGAELSSILPIHGLAGAGTFEAGGTFGGMIMGFDGIESLRSAIQLHAYVLSLTLIFGVIGILILLLGKFNEKKSS